MPISTELLADLFRLLNEKGVLKTEDIEVFGMQVDSRPENSHGFALDLQVKIVLRIRTLAGDKLPPDGPPLKTGELWRWYVENGGTMPLDDLENSEGFVK
jgi:hypothetical protein